MSIARHHNEWLSLIEISGPFLSLPVLMRVFPQGLDALDRDGLAELRLAYEEWLDNQNSLRPSPAIHSAWVRYVLEHVLKFEKVHLLEGPVIPATLSTLVAEQGETLRPDLAIANVQQPGNGLHNVRMLIQVHPANQGLEKSMHERRWKASPAMRMLELLRATGVSLGLVTNGEQWLLVNAPKGETSAFISWYAGLWLEEPLTLRAFTSLLGAPRFFSVADADTLAGMLKDSVNEQQEVTDQLGYQVRRAVEVLIRAVDKADQDRGRKLLKDIPESELYEAALTVMMRLVFLFSAEERGLLLLGDPLYDQNYAVSTLRAQLRETADQQGEEVLERRFDAWCRLLATFRAVHDGIQHDRMNLPAYGGSLFNPDRYPFLEGRTAPTASASLQQEKGMLPISNRTVLHLLEALQILRLPVPGGGPSEPRRLSFRALDVEQIGHVYEGLLDHVALRANEPVLGLAGTRNKEPEILLSILRTEQAKGEKSFLNYLNEQTGRSENALRNALQRKPDVFASQQLQIACNNQTQVFEAILPFVELIRKDDFDTPAVFLAGSVYVTAGATRRATGTHYTPRSLTEPIVQHTLEPLVYTGPAEGLPKEQWTLKSPAELLELKVCDMAMGSAGFLVQVIRYLSERLVEAWDQLSLSLPGRGQGEGSFKELRITPEGKPATGKPGEIIIPQDDEERLILARRLVADRCIYGVDKNPLAVEIAKLSIWLTTMDKGRPFSFLDHALKCGDSLVGADEEMYRRWAYSLKGAQFTLYLTTLEEMTAAARQKRKELESFTVLDVRDAEHKARLLQEADDAMARVKLGCDLLVGVRLLGLKPAEQETMLERLLWDYVAGLPMDTPDAQRALAAARKEQAFHWPFEFPEVFVKGGFSAFVGNPPFIAGLRISTSLGNRYLEYLQFKYQGKGTADLCAYFFLQAISKLIITGTMGFISTNTISQGDTRKIGLDRILSSGPEIFLAFPSIQWPGLASVIVSIILLSKSSYRGNKYLNNLLVKNISPYLDSTSGNKNPNQLLVNENLSFNGVYVLGLGFTLDPKNAKVLIERDKRNQEILFPYLNGLDLNSHPNQEPSRWIINFYDWSLERVKTYHDCYNKILKEVYPDRKNNNDEFARTYWWRYMRPRPNMVEAIKSLDKVLVVAVTSRTLAFVFVPNNWVYDIATVVFAFSDYCYFALLQSTFHEKWSWNYSSTLKKDLRYTPATVFQTFPFPSQITDLENIGKDYHDFRHQIMREQQVGLTATYNRFNNPKQKQADINRLRELHAKMDKAVATAYGWSDLDLDHDFHETAQGVRFTISEPARREVLNRLLQLNHERYEEEVRQGLHEDKKGKKKVNPEEPTPKPKDRRSIPAKGQISFLDVEESEPEPETPTPAPTEPATPTTQIGSWDQCVCLACNKHLMGFSVEEHTRTVHGGKDPGYRKVGL